MKILHLYRNSHPGSFNGIEQIVRQIAISTTHLGISNDVLTLVEDSDIPSAELDGYRLHRVKNNTRIAPFGLSWPAISRFFKLAREADLIHYHFPWPAMDLAHFLGKIKKPTVVTYHADISRKKSFFKLYRPLKHKFLSDVDRIIATSPNYLASSPVLGRYKDKTEIITYGLDKTLYAAPRLEILNKWLERLGVGQKFFLFTGVLHHYKGLHLLLEAAANTLMPVLIIGDGPEEARLKRQACELGLNNVHFLGALPEDDKIALLILSYAIVFPSHQRSESFGLSLLEGAMYGKPMISSEIGTGTSYVNIHGETGLVVRPNDAAALHDAMQFLWTHPQRAGEMGKQAYERYQKLFTSERMAKSYAGLYRQVVENFSAGQA